MLSASVRENIRTTEEVDLFMYHFGLGEGMRNKWGLWNEGLRLKQYFHNLVVDEADSISSLIVTSYWHYLNDRPIELSRLIVYNKIARNEIKKIGPNEVIYLETQISADPFLAYN